MIRYLLASTLLLAPVAYNPANEVDVALVLAVDISQSMDPEEQELQRAGYAAALMSPDFLAAVQYGGPIGRIAVTYMEWGGVGEQFIVADWQIIDGPNSAAHMVEEILSKPTRQVQRTSITDALKRAEMLIDESKYQGLREVIDVSGDGPNNQGGSTTEQRDKLVSKGVIINGLPLMLKAKTSSWAPFQHIDHYYEDCVIGGPGSFVVPVRSKEEFPDAIRRKLVAEIAGVQPSVIPAAKRKPIDCTMFE